MSSSPTPPNAALANAVTLQRTAANAAAVPSEVPSAWIDLAKALASQLIVWHHLALYGPMCDVARPLAPGLLDALAEHARLVVQVFLVTGGFLAASSLWPAPAALAGIHWRDVRRLSWRRYQRLAKPYLVALLAVVFAAFLARSLIDHPTIPPAPEPGQLAAHALLLHDVLGFEALSAGFWYVAIDFQLYVALVLLAAALGGLSRAGVSGHGWIAVSAMLSLVLLSLLWWNRDAGLDAWAPYFAGAYGLGVLACWARGLPHHRRAWAALGLALLVALALLVDWRSRIALAGATALVLCLAPEPRAWRTGAGRAGRALLAWLARVSYPVFLLHYPVLLVVGAVVGSQWPDAPVANAMGLLAAWGLSLAAGAALARLFERR